MTIPIPLQESLRDSITSGSFVDTKFWVFSKANSKSGRVRAPKALFFNERVARRVPRLGARTAVFCYHPGPSSNPLTVLDKCKNKEDLRTRFPEKRECYTTNYGYEEDSDLENDSDYDFSDDESAGPPRPITTEKLGKDLDSLPSDSPDDKHIGKVVFIEDVAFVTYAAFPSFGRVP